MDESEKVPSELKELPQWVCWRYEGSDGKQKKRPISPNSGRPAATNAPGDWSTFKHAQEFLALPKSRGMAGIGFVFSDSDPYCGIDIDNCQNPETGELTPLAQAIVREIGSYTEISPSGRGVHIIVKGKPPFPRCRCSNYGVEIYFKNRYFTFTGNVLDEYRVIKDMRPESWGFLKPFFDPNLPLSPDSSLNTLKLLQEPALVDDLLISKAMAAKNGEKFKRLMEGDLSDHGGDHSGADMALCTILVHLSKGNKAQMDRIFRTSTLMRPKWDERHSADGRTYGEMTIDKAIEYTKEEGNMVTEGECFTAADLIERDLPEPKFVIEKILAEGLAILAGKPKIGKSLFALQMASCVALGEKVLGEFRTEKGTVLYLALEDNERRLQKRIRKLLPKGVQAPKNLIFKTIHHGGLNSLDRLIKELAPVLVIIDTLACFRPGAKRKNGVLYDEDYQEIKSIKAIADQNHTTILLIHHLRKMESVDPIDTVSGTSGLTGAADTILVLTRKGTSRVDAILHIRGRDVEQDEVPLKFDPKNLSWQSLGSPSNLKTTNQQQILFNALKNNSSPEKPLTVPELSQLTELTEQYIRNTLPKFLEDGSIRKLDRGKYYYIGDNKDNAFNADINDNDDNKDIEDNEDKGA